VTASSSAAKVFETLSDAGLLLQQHKHTSSVVTLVTGESSSGSWWSHPRGRLIFAVLSELADHPDVVFTKLLGGKVTLVHRRLWPALLAVASPAKPWQLQGLPPAAQRLLTLVDKSRVPVRGVGAAVKELETRLLVHTKQVHTQSGRHETVLQKWSIWAREVETRRLRSEMAGRRQLEEAVEAIDGDVSALPWR